MEGKQILTFPALFGETVKKHGELSALSFVGNKPLTYNQTNQKVQSLIVLLENFGIKSGDKVAILSANMPNWGISYLAITCMGAIAVPLLPDFTYNEITNILEHSEAKTLFISEAIAKRHEAFSTKDLLAVVSIENINIISSTVETSYVEGSKSEVNYEIKEDDLAAIIYTSGTTGKSKGVMLSHKNICSNAIAGWKVQPIGTNDRFLSILPLSHTYENTLGLVLPIIYGAQVFYIQKPPTPTVLVEAMQSVKPSMMLTVPLIIEKVYRNKISPSFQKSPIIRNLYKIGPIRKTLNKIAGKKLYETFGGNLKFFGIGGAKLDKTVEKFLLEAKFPYAIGYGLTETSPLSAGFKPADARFQSTGPSVEGVDITVHSPNAKTGEGEIWIKGPNIMKGYYKEPILTKKVLTDDGWFKTGDLGIFDKDGYLSIRGRSKNVIVGSSGENIYPEEIESVINNFKHVVESVVIEKKGKLVALVHINRDELEKRYAHLKLELQQQVEEKIDELLQELQQHVNSRVNKFSQLQKVVLQSTPFEKTATQKIKRFMYA